MISVIPQVQTNHKPQFYQHTPLPTAIMGIDSTSDVALKTKTFSASQQLKRQIPLELLHRFANLGFHHHLANRVNRHHAKTDFIKQIRDVVNQLSDQARLSAALSALAAAFARLALPQRRLPESGRLEN